MRLLIGTDILLDVLMERAPHQKASSEVLDWAEKNPGSAAVAWHSLANLHYLSKGGAQEFIKALLQFVEVPKTGTKEMLLALKLDFSDLEDAMQCAAATAFFAQIIITRNIRDYRKSPIKVMSPSEVLTLLQ